MRVYTPSSSGRLLCKEYTVQTLDELKTLDGRVVGQARRTLVSDHPTSMYEIDYQSGLFVPNIKEIRIKSNTFTRSDVMRRLERLHFDVSQMQFDVFQDVDWTVYRNAGVRCGQVGSYVSYRPRAFLPKRDEVGQTDKPNATPSSDYAHDNRDVSGTSDMDHPSSTTFDSWDALKDSTKSTNGSCSTNEPSDTNGSNNPSAMGSDSRPSDSSLKGEPILTRRTNTGTLLYYWRTPNGNVAQTTWDKIPTTTKHGSQVMDYTPQRYEEIFGNSGSQNQNTSSPVGSGSNTFGNSGSSSIEWSPGQTSQTVTSSDGSSVHTIYR